MAQKKTAVWFREMAERYFSQCNGEGPGDGKNVPTVNGLALALGFSCKEQLFTFQGSQLCMEAVKTAITRLEEEVESSLYKKDKYQAAKFVLTNHFSGWTDKSEKYDEATVTIIDDIGGGRSG